MADALTRIEANPISAPLYRQLMHTVEELGPCTVEVKQTSIHVVHGRAFLGIHPRRDGLLLNFVTTAPLQSDRVRRTEQVSANRWHNELLVADLDDELRAFLRRAYALTEA